MIVYLTFKIQNLFIQNYLLKLHRYILPFALLLLSCLALAQSDTQEDYLNSDIEINRFEDNDWRDAAGGLDYQEDYLNEDIDRNEFDEEEWKEATEDLDYNEKEERPKKQRRAKLPSSFFPNIPLTRLIWYTLGVIALIVLLFFVAKYTAGLQAVDKKKKRVYTIEEAEENLLETDLQRFLREALENGDYELAVRVYYLEVLKQLSLKDLIKWQRDKTNSEYLREMRQQTHFEDFRHVTRIFERVWYGDTKIEQATFQQISPEFELYLRKVNDK